MPKKNFRSLFRGSKIRLSFFIQTGKNIYLTSSRHRLVEGHSPEGQGCGHPHHRQGHQHQVRLLLRQDRGRNEHPGTLRRFRRRAPRSRRRFFLPSCKKRKPRGTCDAAGLLLRRRLPTLPLAQYHRRDEA